MGRGERGWSLAAHGVRGMWWPMEGVGALLGDNRKSKYLHLRIHFSSFFTGGNIPNCYN